MKETYIKLGVLAGLNIAVFIVSYFTFTGILSALLDDKGLLSGDYANTVIIWYFPTLSLMQLTFTASASWLIVFKKGDK